MSTKSNRTFFVLLVTLLLIVQPESGAFSPDPADAVAPVGAVGDNDIRSIVFPVAGTSDYSDTFGACRDGCSRSHQGVDIFAPKLTPVVATADGTVVAERRNATGKPGNKIVLEDADGWRYSYFHLNNDSPGSDDDANPQSWIIANDLRAGDTVTAGTIVGYVGDSGNAEATPPHLHFEIKPPGRSPINPTPSVTAARGRGQIVAAADIIAPEAEQAEWADLIDDWYLDVAGRPARDAELAAWSNRFAIGAGTEADLVGDLAMSAPFREPEGVALRAYVAAFSKLPTDAVLDALAELYRGGGSIADLVDLVIESSDAGSEAEPTDKAELALLADSNDVATETWHVFQVVRAYRAGRGRLPNEEELDAWTQHLEQDGLMVDVVTGVLEDSLPITQPRNAGVFGPDELGFIPGDTVRQGPIELDPASDLAPGGDGRGTLGDADVAFELFVEEDAAGTDTANLTVHIPLDQLVAAQAGDAELTVELKLSQADDPDEEAEAEVNVELAIDDSGRRSGPTIRTQPTVRTPTTRPPTTRAPTTRPPTARAPVARAAPTRAPTTQPPTTAPDTSTAPSSSDTTVCSTTTTATAQTTAAPTATATPTSASDEAPQGSDSLDPPLTEPPTTAPLTTAPPTTAPPPADATTGAAGGLQPSTDCTSTTAGAAQPTDSISPATGTTTTVTTTTATITTTATTATPSSGN